MINRPIAEQVKTQLVRLVADRRASVADVAAIGATKAGLRRPQPKRFVHLEEDVIRSARAPVPLRWPTRRPPGA